MKKIPQHRCFLEYCEIFKNDYFEENLRTAASVLLIIVIAPAKIPGREGSISLTSFYEQPLDY